MQVLTLTFVKSRNRRADIVTDGTNVAIYSDKGRTRFDRLYEAIAVLEAAGYRIAADNYFPTDLKSYF